MSNNRRRRPPHQSHHQIVMENHITTRHRKKFWFAFFVLFFFWYMMLYGYDWSSIPGLSSVTHNQSDDDKNQEDSLQSMGSNPIPEPRVVENNREIPIKSSDSNSVPESGSAKNQLENTSTPKSDNDNVTVVSDESNNNDPIVEDLPGLEKEMEPSLPKEEQKQEQEQEQEDKAVTERTTQKPCTGRYVYVHELPSRFNHDYIKECKLLNKWHDMCQYFVNSGLGESLGNPQRLFLPSGWYITHQFSLEVIFHNRMKQYECLTNDSSKAAAIFVPYYSGLDVSRYLWDSDKASVKDSDSIELLKWLREKPEWKLMNGRDHFLVSGRITWDFRRAVDNYTEWGNKLMVLPESQNMTMLTIESSPWDKNDFAIPYPTYFHPRTDEQVLEWQNKMRRQKRRSLFCFAGAPRPNMEDSIRSEIMSQCAAAPKKCRLIECKNDKHNCLKPANVMRMFQNSVFCLQPPGDSFTRRSTFDSILAGCIPVFFSPGSAYVQYLWHLPKDHGSYSVLIPEGDVKRKGVSIDSVLSRIPRSRVSAMREKVIKLIPSVVYADPRSRLKRLDDAFDLTVRGVVRRVEALRKEMKSGRNHSGAFDSESSWKYYTFGTTAEHEWDHYFKRYR
ncbi:hypothetical protein ABFS82_04G181500 [Erythranthe guttata]|uniref:xyloglucan galactosyltransferase KATAMARI1 homolog n=1 Tax=Erythranthe guttata TaxID=4155 RepID=UPI00064DFEFA|nr:PREDICTED: xyloglucan galactosyltransferase KATAMARI1 homolog [Erythranthe guttata]|eukprot:XP_012827844.1 PREDICTED: xyloglucan galactosyltransferase KATAMARI1 homolog [Erythranthe guttata]